MTEKILNSAFDLFMKYGVRSVSMDDICRKLGCSKKTIYNIIDNKKDLVKKVISRHIDADEVLISEMKDHSANAIEEMAAIGAHIVKFMRSMGPSVAYDLKKYHPEAWAIIDERHFSFIYTTIKTNIERGQKEGLYRKGFKPDIIAKLYVMESRTIADEEVFPMATYSKPELFQELFAYHMRGIVSPKGIELVENINI